jgi:hypothetical protein
MGQHAGIISFGRFEFFVRGWACGISSLDFDEYDSAGGEGSGDGKHGRESGHGLRVAEAADFDQALEVVFHRPSTERVSPGLQWWVSPAMMGDGRNLLK